MDTADAQEGHPSEDEVDGSTLHSAEKKLPSKDEVDGGTLHLVEKELPSENTIEGQTLAGTEATVMDEKSSQNVITDPNEQNDMSVPKTNDQAEVSQSTTDNITVIDAKKLTCPEGEAVYEKDECVSGVEETSCGHTDGQKSKNESNDILTNSLSTDDVHQTRTDDLSSDHGILTKSKEAVPEKAACEQSADDSLTSLAEQPKHDQNLLEETTHSVCGFSLQASTHHEGCDSSDELVIDEPADNQHKDDVHQTLTDETSSDHGAVAKPNQTVPEESIDVHQTSIDITSFDHGAFRKSKQLDLDETACEPNEDGFLSPLAEQQNCDQNLLEETPASTCEDHVDGSSSQASTHHEGCDSSGELIINKVGFETNVTHSDENKSSNESIDTNNPPKDMVSLSNRDETFSDHVILAKQNVQGELSKDGSSFSHVVEHPGHGKVLEETAFSGCEDQSTAKTDTESGVRNSSGELVIDKDKCETEHWNGSSGACQKLREKDSQCQDSNDSISQSTRTEGREFAIRMDKSLHTGEQGDGNSHDNSCEFTEVVTSKTTESTIDEQIQKTEEVARPEQCVEISSDFMVVSNHGEENMSGCGEGDATDPQDCDANPAEGDAVDPSEGDAADPSLICPTEVDTSDPPEDDTTDPPEGDAADPSLICLPEVDTSDPPEDDTTDPPEGDATDPSLICPPEVDASDPPEDDTTDPPEGDAADPPLICPPEVDNSDPPTDPPEGDAADPPLICPQEVDASDPPEDDTTDSPQGDAADPPLICPPEADTSDPSEDTTDPPEGDAADPSLICPPVGDASDPPEGDAADPPLICPPVGDASDPLEGDAADPPLICPPVGDASDLRESDAADPPLICPPEVDASDPPEDDTTDSPQGDAADLPLICPPEVDTSDPSEDDTTDPPEGDAADPSLICPPVGDASDPLEGDAADPPLICPPVGDASDLRESDAADPPLICPPEVDASDPPEDDTTDPPEGDAADPSLICPPEVDASDPPEDDTTDPPEGDASDPPLICPPEVDTSDPPEDDTTDPPEGDAADPSLICPLVGEASDPLEGDAADPPLICPSVGDASDPLEGDAADPPLICPPVGDASDPLEGDAADPPLICPPEVDASDPPEDDTTDPPEGDAADPPLICPPLGDASDLRESEAAKPKEGDAADPPEHDATEPLEDDVADGTEGITCSPIRKNLELDCESEPLDVDHIQANIEDNISQDKAVGHHEEHTCSSQGEVHSSKQTCESQPFDVDHIQSSTEDISQDKKVVRQHEEHICSFQDEVHCSEQTCESQPFDVDHIQSSTEDNISKDISTDKEHPGEHLRRGCPVTENEKMTDNIGEDTVTEEKWGQDAVLRDDVSQPESAAKGTFSKKDTANSSHGFVMLSPFTLTREEFDAQGNSSDLKKSSEQASVASAARICNDVENTDEGRGDSSVSKGEHKQSGSSEVAERPCSDTSYFEAGDTENETSVTGTEDEAGEEVNNGGDDEKTADNDSKDKTPQKEVKMKSPEKGRISIGYSKRKDKFKCFLCDEIGSGSSFEEHVMQHLLWKPYKCLYCSQYFITRSDIGMHVSESHDGKQLRCGLRAIKKAKDCMREAQRKGTCVYFADKLNGMYWSCKKKKMEDEATLENEKAGEGTIDMSSPQGSEQSCQGAKQMAGPGVDLHQAVESNQTDVNQRSNESVLDQRNVIQPRSGDFHATNNTSDTAKVNQEEIRNSTPEAVLTLQSVKQGEGDSISATSSLGTVSATAVVSMAAVGPAAMATVTAQVQAATEGQSPVSVQPIPGTVTNVFPSIMPGTISPQSRNIRVVQTTGLTVPPVPLFLNAVSGGVMTSVMSNPSNTQFSSVLTSQPQNSVVGQLTLSPPKIMPKTHIITSNPNQIIIGNQATVPVNQQPNMQPIFIPVPLNTNRNMNVNPVGMTSVAVCPTVSPTGENSKREIKPAKSKGSSDKNPKPKDKQLKFHDTTQTFMSPSASANIAILPRLPAPVQNSTVLTSFLVPSQQTLSGTPQVLNPTASPGFIPQNVSFVNPNCQLLVIQKAGYGTLMEVPSVNQKAPTKTQTFNSPNNPKPSEVQHTVTSNNIPTSEGQKHTLATESFLYKPQSLEPSKRVCVMFTVGLVNGTYACAMCRGRFKHESSFRAHLWNHIHDVNLPCPDCKMCIVNGLKTLTCAKTEGYIEKLKNSMVGMSSYLEIKGYRTVSNATDSQHSNPPNEPNTAQKNPVDKSKLSPPILDISSEVVTRDPVQKTITLESRPNGSAPTVHGNEVIPKTGVEEQSVTLESGDPSNAGKASGTEEPSLKEVHTNNEKSKATPVLTSMKVTSGTVSSVDAHNTEGHLPSRTPIQDSDQRSKDVAKPVSSVEGGHTSSDAKDSQTLVKRSETDLNSNTPSPVKAATTWTFYVCGAQCGYSSLYPQELKKHVGECSMPGSLLCSHCQYSSDGPESLLRHLVKHYVGHAPGVAVHTCSVSGCRFTTNILQGYYQHLATNHTDVKEYECNYCKDAFSDLLSFMKHLQENILHIVSCRYCSARDCAKTVLVRHIMESHPGKSRMTNMLKHLVCKDRKDNRLNALSVSSARSTSAPPVDASKSPASAGASAGASTMLVDDGPVGQNIVLEDDRTASPASPENTDAHLSCNEPGDETSLGGSPDTSLDPVFGCHLCTYVGVDRHDLNTHIAKHDKKADKVASSFPCTECPEGFSFLSNFEIHLRKHSKLLTYNLYVCSVCKFEMGSNDEMLNHMANIHKLTGKAQLQFSRTLKVSKTDVLSCSSCPFQCLGQDVLDKHRQRCHLSGTNKIPNQMSDASTNEDLSPASNKSAEDGEKHVGNTSTERVTNIQQHIAKDHPEIEIVVETGKIGSPVKKVMTDAAPKKEEQNDTRLQLGSPLLDIELEWLYECHGSSYRCMMCLKSLYKKNYLHGHILDHLDISLWKCKECDFKSSRRNTVKDHMNDVHDKKCHTEEIISVVDEVRPKIFKVLGKLIQDDQVVTDVKPSLGTKELDDKLKNKYKVIGKQKICRRCETEHQSLYSMHSHILRRHFGLHLFKCCYCDFSGLERYSVAKHCKEKHPEKELTVRYLHNNIKDLLSDEGKKRHERSHLSTTKSSSPDHSLSYKRQTELRVGSDMLDQKLQPLYDVRMGKTRKLICKSCKADYPSKYSLHCHLLKHLKINLVACPHCNFELLEQSKIGAHIKVVHPGSHVYFKFLDVDIESAVNEYMDKKEGRHETERNKSSKAVKPKLSDILGRRKPTSPIKPVRSPGKISKNVMPVTAGGLKRFKCRLCGYMALTKNSVGTHFFKVHNNSGTQTTTVTTNSSKSLVPDYFTCKFCKFKTHLLELLKPHYKHKHPLETMDEPKVAQENNIESGDEGGDDFDGDITPDSVQKFPFLHSEKENCRSEDGNQNSESAHSGPAKGHDQHEMESSLRRMEEARVVLEKVDVGVKVVSDISERVKLKKRKEICLEENAEVQPAKKTKTLESEPRRVSYKCPKCSYVDCSKAKAVLHLKTEHNVSKLMHCAHCSAPYITEDSLKSHSRFLHKGKEILYEDKPLESLLQEVTGSQPSEVAPGIDDSQSSGKSSNAAQKKSALPEGSLESDQAPNSTKSSKPLKDEISQGLKTSKKTQHRAEASNISSKDSSKDVSRDSKTAANINDPEESMYAALVPSSPDNSDHEERVYYKYVCVYCDIYRNRKSAIKAHLAKHCVERLHGNKIPEAEAARLKIKKKVQDIIPICVERANNKKIKISSQTETIKPDASSRVSEAETPGQSTVQQKRDANYENKASKCKGDVESESDSGSIVVMTPSKKKRRRIKPVISSSDEDEPRTACKEKKVKTTSQSIRTYYCHLCRYKVGSLYKFRSHLVTHGNFKHLNPDMSLGLLLKCGLCGYEAVDKESFSQHVEEHLDGRIFKCGYCKYKSDHRKNMRSHLKNKHRHKPEKMIDLRISMNERALQPSGKPELVNLDPIVRLTDVFMSKDFARLLKEQGVRTVDMDEAMKDVVLGEPGQMIEVMDVEIADFSDEEDSNSDDEYRLDDDGGITSSFEGSDVPLEDLELDDVSDDDLFKMAPFPTD